MSRFELGRNMARREIAVMVVTAALFIVPVNAVAATTDTCYEGIYVSSVVWSYDVCGMPDIDQKRAGLPGNGQNYCLPTATLNTMFWFDKTGYPNLLDGSYDPTSSEPYHYNEVTAKLSRMGGLADTDPLKGTNRNDNLDAINDLIESKGYENDFDVSWESLDEEDNVSQRIVQLSRGAEDLMIASIGWYDSDGDRTGGHAVTVVGAYGHANGLHGIKFHDPANDANLTTQSPTAIANYRLGNDNGDGSEVIGYGSSTITARLEGVTVISTG
ncbi:hypothetical protein ACFWFF_22490 [Streptomyces sp. NPDC060223]|uniref:hypothetical protein n=1 Tax=unclassified Streptomyces TaxID=2593676 RepID=UPI003640D1F5